MSVCASASGVDLRALLLVLAEHADRLGVLDDVLRVPGRAVRVDRCADGADEREREVEHRPLERRLPEDRERSRPCARRARGGRVRARRRSARLRPTEPPASRRRARPDRPGAVRFSETAVSHRRPIVRPCKRSLRGSSVAACVMERKRSWRKAEPKGERARSLYNRGSRADDLERLTQLRPGQHPGRPRAGDFPEGARVRRLVPATPSRVQDADSAEALVPGARPRGGAGRDRQGLGGVEGRVRRDRGRRPRGDPARRRLARDRDHALRPARRGRPRLLRPDVLPGSCRTRWRSGVRTCSCSRR